MTLPDQRGSLAGRGDERVDDDGRVTLAIVGARLSDLIEWVKGIDAKVDALDDKFVSRREFEKLEERVTWTGRAALTGILLPIIVLVIGYLIFGHAATQ